MEVQVRRCTGRGWREWDGGGRPGGLRLPLPRLPVRQGGVGGDHRVTVGRPHPPPARFDLVCERAGLRTLAKMIFFFGGFLSCFSSSTLF